MTASIRLEAQFATAAADWATLVALPGLDHEAAFQAVRAEAIAIADRGGWTSGPSDLMTILRRHRDEVLHSRVLAWLMTPTGRHGLGRSFLKALLAEIWPAELLGDGGSVTIELERPQSGVSGLTGEILTAQADIVIRTDSVVVVIENKVGAGEQPIQCERLYWAWAADPTETRWVFLSPTGRTPSSTVSDAARDAWACLSYAQVRAALVRALDETASRSMSAGRQSASQYLWTLEAHG